MLGTNAKWEHFLEFLGNFSTNNSIERLSGKPNSYWLIDSGASHHVTGSFGLLNNVHDVSDCPIGLPDGKQMISTKQGDVILCSEIVLRNVYYIPQLQCNLISVTQLIDDLNCTVHFTKTFVLYRIYT